MGPFDDCEAVGRLQADRARVHITGLRHRAASRRHRWRRETQAAWMTHAPAAFTPWFLGEAHGSGLLANAGGH